MGNKYIICGIIVFFTFLFFAAILVSGIGSLKTVGIFGALYGLIFIPIIEEYLFRVVIQGFLIKKGVRLFFANVLNYVVFACCHLVFYSALHSMGAFFISIMLGYVYAKTSSFYSVVFIHCIFNMNIFIAYKSYISISFF